ncbi:MAG: hypothetical protein H6838_00545 [Planctomycetes bacterium]|nr:hypothetical protein [Planctomycetota bacterium]MCB9883943.1 hypothetical protein [Planctomycetota bacterium]
MASIRQSRPRRRSWPLVAALLLGSCTQTVVYANELVDPRYGRTWFTRFPATVGGTTGFIVGLPIDIVAIPVTGAYYQAQPKETRDLMSVFLFPSFVLWKAGTLFGAPFDLVEWVAWRSWQDERELTQEERDVIERTWDAKEYSEYPVTPVYPRPATDPDGG